MAFNFGNITFRKGNQPYIGHPIEVVDKVGTYLTERYNQNRAAAVEQQAKILNLPDSNSEMNKKIIADLANGVKQEFEKYSKEDTWHYADNAVYDVATKLATSQEVKDLLKYNAQYNKVEEDIEKSGANERYKQLQRKYNQLNNKGIRDEKGNSLSYQGMSLSGDLNLSKYTKEINDLISNWKPDKIASAFDNGYVNGYKTPDNFIAMVHKYGKQTIESVNPDEVRNFVTAYVMSNSNLNSELADIARLDLFEKTSKLNPDHTDIAAAIADKAKYDPTTAKKLIVNSKEFGKKTAKMNDEDKYKFLNGIYNDSDLRESYLQKGLNDYVPKIANALEEDPRQYMEAYNNIIREQYISSINGLIDKVSYSDKDIDIKFDEASLNGKMYENHIKNLDAFPIVTETGQFDGKNAADYIENRDDIISQLTDLSVEYSSDKTSDARKKQIAEQMSVLRGRKEAADMYVERIASDFGIDSNLLLDNKNNEITKSVLRSFTKYGDYYGPNLSNSEMRDFTNILIENKDNLEDAKQAIKERFKTNKNSGINDNDIQSAFENINDIYHTRFKESIKGIKANVSSPFMSVGYIGNEPESMTKLKDYFLKQYVEGNGNATILESWDEERVNQTTAAENPSLYRDITDKSTEGYASNIVSIEPLIYDPSSPDSYSPTFRVTIRDFQTKGLKKEVIRFHTNPTDVNDMYVDLVKQASKSTLSPKNPYRSTTTKAAQVYAGMIGASLPVISRDGKDVNNVSLGNAIHNIRKNSATGSYPDILFKFGSETNLKLQFVDDVDNKSIKAYVKDPITNETIFTTSAKDKYGIMQYLGAEISRQQASDQEDYLNISTMFNLPIKK